MLPVSPTAASSARGRSSQMSPTKRPGASRWSGSNWSLTRRIRSSAGTGPHTSTPPCVSAGRVDDDGAAAVRACRRRAAGGRGRRASGGRGVQHAGAGGAAHRQRRRRPPAASTSRRPESDAGELEADARRRPRVRRPPLGGVVGDRWPRRRAAPCTVRARCSQPVGATAEPDGERAAAAGVEVDLDRAGHGLGVRHLVREPVRRVGAVDLDADPALRAPAPGAAGRAPR